LEPAELLRTILGEFGVDATGEDKVALRKTLREFLEKRPRPAILAIDEAHLLSEQSLEQVRLLSNFETSTSKLLQILLVGQPELKAKLALPELRQLAQRVGLRCQIPPLTPDETVMYIKNRLRVAGASDDGIFKDSAIDRITQYAAGIPRVINVLGDHCLLFGYADQKRHIDRAAVNQAIEYLEDGLPTHRRVLALRRPAPPERSRWFGKTFAAVLVLAVAAAGAFLTLEPSALQFVQSLRMTVLP
jgi:hypothetical protein